MLRVCSSDAPPAELEEPEACLAAVLGGKASDYSESRLGPAPYQKGPISLPVTAGHCCLLDHLRDSDLQDLDRFSERLTLSNEDFPT